MKKIILLSFLLVASFTANAQSTIFEDSFESYTDFAITGVGNWTLTDVDLGATGNVGTTMYPNGTVPQAFQVFNSTTTVAPLVPSATSNWSARTGVKNMVCKYKSTAPRLNDDWMISPQIVLGTSNTVKFWAKACSGVALENIEKFNVWISSTNTSIPSFVQISAGAFISTPATPAVTYVEYSYTIPASYNNSNVYIGIHCISADQYGFAVDDFKVTGTVPCPAPTAGVAIVSPFLDANLSWTSGGATSAQVVYQIAGTGTPSAAPATGTTVTGVTFATPALVANTNYEFYVRDVCTVGTLYSSWSGPYLFNTIAVPDCATLNTPINAAVNVPLTLVTGTGAALDTRTARTDVLWTPPTTGGTITDYDIYLGTTVANVALLGTLPAPSNGASLPLLYNTTYYWKSIPKNSSGQAAGCSTNSFTTAVATSCLTNIYTKYPTTTYTPLVFDSVTPNVVSTLCYGSEYSEINVTAGQNYKFSSSVATDYVTISTDGGLTSVAFGLTPVIWTSTLTGAIRFYLHADNKCTDSNVSRSRIVTAGPNLATNTFSSINFQSFPNPIKDVLNLSYDKNITLVSVINLLGQEVLSIKNSANDAKIDMSGLTAGAYMVKISSDNEVKTIKVIKE